MPQRLAFNGGQWSQYEGMIRDYATNNCTKDDGTYISSIELHLLIGIQIQTGMTSMVQVKDLNCLMKILLNLKP